jgi:hypothetical protein
VDPQKNRTVEAAKKLALDIHSSQAFFDRVTGLNENVKDKKQ